MDDEELPPPELGKSSKNTPLLQDDDAMSSSSNPANKHAPPGPRRSARATKFYNPYGYLEKKIPVECFFTTPIPRTGGTLDKSKINLPILTKRDIRNGAREQARQEALRRACQNGPPRVPDVDPGTIVQRRRQQVAGMYRTRYRYGPNNDSKTCIWSAGGRYSWSEPSSGLTWVAVHGADQTCVVSRWTPAVDPARLSDMLKGESEVRRWVRFLETVIAGMEDPTTDFFQKIDQNAKTSPFAVVSVDPGTNESISEASSATSNVEQSVEFLVETLKYGVPFSSNEIVQTAISALQHLFCQKFKPEDIVAYVIGKWEDGRGLMPTKQVAEHLADIVV